MGKKKIKEVNNRMSKKLNDWLDEFVENGASPNRVTEWPDEAGGGTTVVANPELVGTEANLTGLQVGETKYKVPEGGGSANLGLKYQDTRDVVDFVYTDIYTKLYDGIASSIELDTSKLKQIIVNAGVDLNQPFHDSGESSDSGMEQVKFIFNISYTTLDESDNCYVLFKSYDLRILVYYSYGTLYDIRIDDGQGHEISKIDLTGVIGLTTWEDLLDWMIENNQNLTIGRNNPSQGIMEYWGTDIYSDFQGEYNWATYPTFSTVYIDNWGEDPYRGDPLYVDIQDLKDALIYK